MTLTSRPNTTVLLLALVALAGCDALVSVDNRVARAEAGLEQGDWERALAESKKALDKAPDNAHARVLLARAALALGDLSTAATEIERAAAAGAAASEVEPTQVEILLQSGRLDDAGAALAAASTLTGAPRERLAGRLLLARADAPGAQSAFERALAAEPGDVDSRLGRAQALLAQGRLAEGRAELEAVLADHPDSGAAWLLQGQLEAEELRYAQAAESFAKASANAAALSWPERIRALAGRVEMLVLAGQLDEAARVQGLLEKAAPASPTPLITGARLALATGDPRAAVERLQRVVQGIPNLQSARALLVEALLRQGSPQQALAEAGKLLGDFPESDLARLTLASAQAETGRLADAEATLQPLIERPGPSPRALAFAAQLRQRQGQGASSLDYLERGVAISPDDPRLKLELASGYLAAGQAARAVEVLRGIPEGVMGAQRDRLLVVAVAASRDPQAARAEIERAVAANPEDADLLVLAAGYYASLPDLAQARSHVDRALAANPGSAAALLAAARLDLRGGQLDSAEANARRVLEGAPSNLAALGLMAEVALARGQVDEVERWLQEARRADSAAIPPRLLLARAAFRRGDEARASELIAEIDRAAPNQARVQQAVGELLAEAGRAEPALQRFRRATELDASLPQPQLGIARLRIAERDMAAARVALEQALKIEPGWFPAASVLAQLEAAEGRSARALEIVADLKRRQPGGLQPLVLEGDVHRAARNPAEAARAYQQALDAGGDGTVAARAAYARRDARLANPETPLLRRLEQSPGDVAARRHLATIYLTTARPQEAIAQYELIVATATDDALSLNNLAWLYQEQKDSRALETARQAYELAKSVPAIADTYAWILVQGGDVSSGLKILREVADKEEKNGTIQYHYGYALNAAGEPAEAREALRRALAAGAFPERAAAEALLGSLER